MHSRENELRSPRFVRLRGGRSCADGAKGTCPFGIPFSAAAGLGALLPLIRAVSPAKRTAGETAKDGNTF